MKSAHSTFILFHTLLLFFLYLSCKKPLTSTWTEMQSPADVDSETPNLHTGPDGTVYLSWMEWTPDTTSIFYFSTYEGTKWSEKKEIARGRDWFVNWADYPSLTAFEDSKHLSAHWLQKSAKGKYEYNVMISISPDKGLSWKAPFVLHQDSIPAEHGFVSSVRDGDKLFYCWLDGRKTSTHDAGHGSHETDHGPMTLRGAWIDVYGNKSGEQELDSLVCDCCQTSAVKTSNGLVVSYRDRSPDEIRDIAHVIWSQNKWSLPEHASPDHWKIAGCPVNGPSISNSGNSLYLGWYGIKDSIAHVSLLTSKNDGKDWSKSVLLDHNSPIGRVDVSSNQDHVWVSWIGRDHRDSIWINVATMDPASFEFSVEQVEKTNAARKSGFPVMACSQYGLIIAYTSVLENETKVKLKQKAF